MADFRETVQEHIDSLSQDELAATAARRLQREAGPGGQFVLEARWDRASTGDGAEPVTKAVTIEIEQPAAPGGDGILRIFEGPAFKETILLSPVVYRLIAGGSTLGGGQEDRFFIVSDGPEKVSMDRAALALLLRDIHPAELARAARLIAAEPRGPVKSEEALQKLTAAFTKNWACALVHDSVDQLVAKVPSRVLHLIAGKDYVSLSVRKEELLTGEDGLFKSPLAAAIVPPKDVPARPAILIAGDAGAFRDRDAPFLKNTFGSGPLRRLVLDVVKLKDLAAGLDPEPRDAALGLLAKLIERATELNREQPPRRPFPPQPAAPVRPVRRAAPPPPRPFIEDEAATIAPDLHDVASAGSGESLEDGLSEDQAVLAPDDGENESKPDGEPVTAMTGDSAEAGPQTTDDDAPAGHTDSGDGPVNEPIGEDEAGKPEAAAPTDPEDSEEPLAVVKDDDPGMHAPSALADELEPGLSEESLSEPDLEELAD